MVKLMASAVNGRKVINNGLKIALTVLSTCIAE